MLQKEQLCDIFFNFNNFMINKKASSGLVRKFTTKKLEFKLRAVFFKKFFLLIIAL